MGLRICVRSSSVWFNTLMPRVPVIYHMLGTQKSVRQTLQAQSITIVLTLAAHIPKHHDNISRWPLWLSLIRISLCHAAGQRRWFSLYSQDSSRYFFLDFSFTSLTTLIQHHLLLCSSPPKDCEISGYNGHVFTHLCIPCTLDGVWHILGAQ